MEALELYHPQPDFTDTDACRSVRFAANMLVPQETRHPLTGLLSQVGRTDSYDSAYGVIDNYIAENHTPSSEVAADVPESITDPAQAEHTISLPTLYRLQGALQAAEVSGLNVSQASETFQQVIDAETEASEWDKAYMALQGQFDDLERMVANGDEDDIRGHFTSYVNKRMFDNIVGDQGQTLNDSDMIHMLTFNDAWQHLGSVSAARDAYDYWFELINIRRGEISTNSLLYLHKRALSDAINLAVLRQKIDIDGDKAANVAWRVRHATSGPIVDATDGSDYIMQNGELVPLIPGQELPALAKATRKYGALLAMYLGCAEMDTVRESVTREMMRVMARRTLATHEQRLGLTPTVEGLPPRWKQVGLHAGAAAVRANVEQFSAENNKLSEGSKS